MTFSKHHRFAFSVAAPAFNRNAARPGFDLPQIEPSRPPLRLESVPHKQSEAPVKQTSAPPVTSRQSLNTNDRHVFDIWAMRVAIFYFLVALGCVVTGMLSSDRSVDRKAAPTIEFVPAQGLEIGSDRNEVHSSVAPETRSGRP